MTETPQIDTIIARSPHAHRIPAMEDPRAVGGHSGDSPSRSEDGPRYAPVNGPTAGGFSVRPVVRRLAGGVRTVKTETPPPPPTGLFGHGQRSEWGLRQEACPC